jgi:hypothetical protein
MEVEQLTSRRHEGLAAEKFREHRIGDNIVLEDDRPLPARGQQPAVQIQVRKAASDFARGQDAT